MVLSVATTKALYAVKYPFCCVCAMYWQLIAKMASDLVAECGRLLFVPLAVDFFVSEEGVVVHVEVKRLVHVKVVEVV
jgi:hypothetical protein